MPVKGMNLLLIKPFNFVHICLLAVGVGAIYLIWYKLRGKSEKTRERFLIGLCVANIALYFIYKVFLSVDAEFVQVSGLEKFNWFNELPLQLCNINLFLIPIGILTRKRGILGFAFFIAPLGAAMALTFPEIAFNGYSLLLPRMLGFYFTHLLLIVCGARLLPAGVQGFPRNRRRVHSALAGGAPRQHHPAQHCMSAGGLFLHLRSGYQRSEPALERHPDTVCVPAAGAGRAAGVYGGDNPRLQHR